MTHVVMVGEGKSPFMPIARGPKLRPSWRLGRSVTPPAALPLTYTLDPDYPGRPKPMYDAEAVPVMCKDVAQALRDAGVDNMQYVPAVLVHPATGERFEDYLAYNIVGLVSAADLRLSAIMKPAEPAMPKIDFGGLVLDEVRIPDGLLIFRLSESPNAVVVHERVKRAIEASGIPGFVFYGPGTWSG